jgi:hypothetical protein
MSLLQYLSKYFPNGETGEFEEVVVQIVPHFLEKFGVDVKREDDLFLFKYDQLAARWSFPITHECRGVILRNTNGVWKFVCRPFDKFFNQHEPYCSIVEEGTFNSNCPQLAFVEKADGSMINVWFDDVKMRWRASTGGTITPGNVGDYNITFDTLFFQTLALTEDKLTSCYDKSCTYIHELCCEENRIVTKYPENKVFLLGIREVEYGTYQDINVQEETVLSVMEAGGKLSLPYRINFPYVDVKNLEEAKAYVESQSTNFKDFGDYPEGFIIYDGFKPLCKMKNSRYLQMHAFSGGDIAHTRNMVIQAFFTGTLDDYYMMLTDRMKEFADSLKDKVIEQYKKMAAVSDNFVGKTFETQKDYALAVQKHVDRPFHSFFFSEKENILDAGMNLQDVFRKWITKNYGKFEDYWKGRN